MIYECDQCSKPLPPGVSTCPSCGETFEGVVPADAEVPSRGFGAAPLSPASPLRVPAPFPGAQSARRTSTVASELRKTIPENDYSVMPRKIRPER